MVFADALYRVPIETLYTFLVVAACGFIAWRAGSLYALSGHAGLRLFRNAFVFFGLAFIVRYFMHLFYQHGMLLYPLFGILIGLAGYSLLDSILRKRWRSSWLLYLLAPVFPLLDLLFTQHYMFLYLSQIALFSCGLFLVWRRYVPNRHGTGQLYLIAMVLFLVGWIANFAGQLLLVTHPWSILYVYGVTVGIFCLFVFGIGRMSRW